jgi:AraC family transcriptional regulator
MREYGDRTFNVWEYRLTGQELGDLGRRWEATVRSTRRQHLRHDLIDFASNAPAGGFTFNEHLSVGPVTLVHCTSLPIEGRYLAASQVMVTIHEGKAFEMNWRGPESDRIQSITVTHGQTHIGDARLPLWVRYSASPSFFALALDEAFVSEISLKAFNQADEFAIRTSIGVQDPVIGRLGALARRELSEDAPGRRLYLEGLAAMLTVHLLRSYGSPERSPIAHRGGLAPRQMRRVLDYIDAHLTDELGLIELAAIAGLSPHHFVEAFKISVGKPPHQLVMERRVQRAQELLRDDERSIAEIAHAAGFSSQSHLTANFRRATGLTPSRFRRSLS